MRTLRSLWIDQRGEGGVSGGAMVAIVMLIIALIALVLYFTGAFGGGSDEPDIEVRLDGEIGLSVPDRPEAGDLGQDIRIRA